MWAEFLKLSKSEPEESQMSIKKIGNNMMHCAFRRSAGREFLGSYVNFPSSFQDWLDHVHLLLMEKAILKKSDIDSLFF